MAKINYWSLYGQQDVSLKWPETLRVTIGHKLTKAALNRRPRKSYSGRWDNRGQACYGVTILPPGPGIPLALSTESPDLLESPSSGQTETTVSLVVMAQGCCVLLSAQLKGCRKWYRGHCCSPNLVSLSVFLRTMTTMFSSQHCLWSEPQAHLHNLITPQATLAWEPPSQYGSCCPLYIVLLPAVAA